MHHLHQILLIRHHLIDILNKPPESCESMGSSIDSLLHFFNDADFSFGENFDSIECKKPLSCNILRKPFRIVRFDSLSVNKLHELI